MSYPKKRREAMVKAARRVIELVAAGSDHETAADAAYAEFVQPIDQAELGALRAEIDGLRKKVNQRRGSK
jgi:hypothetical protein